MNKFTGEYILGILDRNMILIAMIFIAAVLAVALYAASDF